MRLDGSELVHAEARRRGGGIRWRTDIGVVDLLTKDSKMMGFVPGFESFSSRRTPHPRPLSPKRGEGRKRRGERKERMGVRFWGRWMDSIQLHPIHG
jgi:hypothetical protein